MTKYVRERMTCALGGHGPSSPSGPNGLLRGSESAKTGGRFLEVGSGGAALRTAPHASGHASRGSAPMCVES
eukprot:8075928-Alexandrium_andersonii.AAC.1